MLLWNKVPSTSPHLGHMFDMINLAPTKGGWESSVTDMLILFRSWDFVSLRRQSLCHRAVVALLRAHPPGTMPHQVNKSHAGRSHDELVSYGAGVSCMHHAWHQPQLGLQQSPWSIMHAGMESAWAPLSVSLSLAHACSSIVNRDQGSSAYVIWRPYILYICTSALCHICTSALCHIYYSTVVYP